MKNYPNSTQFVIIFFNQNFPKCNFSLSIGSNMCFGCSKELFNDQFNIYVRERSGSVVECLTRDRRAAGLEPHQRHCVVVLEQDTFILA